MVSGGLPEGSGVLLQGPAGLEALRVSLAFLAEGLRSGASGILLTSQTAESIFAELQALDVDLEAVTRDKRLRVLEWRPGSSEPAADAEERGVLVVSAADLSRLARALGRAMAALPKGPHKRAVVAVVSQALNLHDPMRVHAFAESAKRALDQSGFTSVFLVEKGAHPAPVIATLAESFDGLLELERSEAEDRVEWTVAVPRLRDTPPVARPIPLELSAGGVRPRSPDAVVPSPQAPSPSTPAPPGEIKKIVRPPLAEQRLADPYRTREQLVHEIAAERLRNDPGDKDAWFALATAQAGLRDAVGSLASLDKLAALDPNYPGLWLLKAKLHARLGQEEAWRQARMKADRYAESSGDLSPCPVCAQPIAPQSSLCPYCGSHTEGREITAAERKAPVPEAPHPAPAPSVPPPPPPKPAVPPAPGDARKGLTNGLIMERAAARRATLSGDQARTNGLAKAAGRTNGLTNGLGHTNGLTNGTGRTNGLNHGLAKVASKHGFFGGRGRTRWKRLGLVAALVVLIILLPIVFFWTGPSVSYPIQVDGQFSDWSGVAKVAALSPPTAPNPDIEITRVAVTDNIDFLAFYIQVQGSASAGGPAPVRTTNAYFAFIDSDRSRATGYQIQGIGADRIVQVQTWGGNVIAASVMESDPARGHQDWNGWVAEGSVAAAAAGSQLEFQVPWSDLGTSRSPAEVAFAARSWDGQSDAADVVASSAGSYVLVSQNTGAPLVVSGTSSVLSSFTFHAVGSDTVITSLNVSFQGTFGPTSLSAVDLADESGNMLAEQPASSFVHFTLNAFTVSAGTNRTVTVRPKVGTADGTTVGAFLANLQDVVVTSGGVAFVGPVRTPKALAYIGSTPAGPVVDGGFAEWSNVTPDPVGDVQPVWNHDVDLSGYAFQGKAGSTYFMAQAAGTALNGTMIPALNPSYVPPANGTGNGTVTPSNPPLPPENGTDLARFYLDTDGSPTTGYLVGGIGADYLLQVTGKEGVILSAVALRFNGVTPSDWSWVSLGVALATKDASRIEAALPSVPITNASRAYFEMTGWNGARDDSSPASPALVALALPSEWTPAAPIAPSVGVNPIGVQPLDIPGNQKWYFTSAAPSPNAATCTSNFAASTTPGTSATSTTLTGTQSICWYTPTGQPSSTNAGPWDFTLDLSRVDSTQTFVPNAQGTYNQWGVVGCTLASSNACVSSNDGNTSYIASTNNQPNVDTFNIPDWASPPSPLNITNVRVSVWCYAASAQPGKVATYIMNGTTNFVAGTATACSQGPYTDVASDYATYPWGTARPWTAADINALEIGAQDADNNNREIRVTYVQLTVSYTPVYAVSIFLCSQSNCGAGSFLYGPTNVAAYGNNITITTGTIPAQTLAANDRIRFQVALVSGTSVTVNYNGPTVPGTSDSRASVPIPEFSDIVIPIAATLLIAAVIPRWRRSRRNRASAREPPDS